MSSVKQVLKSIIQKHGLPLFYLLRLFYTPSPQMRKSLLFRGRFKVQTADKKTFLLFNDRFYLETNFFWLGFENHTWESFSRKVWAHLSKHSETILDIGANTGVYSLLAKSYNPAAQVIAFEPQENIYKLLVQNNQLNRLDIICEKLALSDTEGKHLFYNYGPDTFSDLNTTAGSLNKDWKPEDQHSIEVQVARLDSYLARKKVSNVDLIKIDVETLEYEVLLGYGELLFQHTPVILLEIQTKEIGSKIQDLLKSHEYLFFLVEETEGLKKVNELSGPNTDSRNYLLVPQEKTSLVSMFEVTNSREDHR